jgi:hypothetical protein
VSIRYLTEEHALVIDLPEPEAEATLADFE